MIEVSFHDKAVVVTGGTRGLGKAIGFEFARAGAKTFLTHRWGSVNEQDLVGEFVAAGLPAPHVIESDASDPQAAVSLMQAIKMHAEVLDVIVSNVAFAKVARGVDELKKASLDLSLAYSAWPIVELLKAAKTVLGRYPRYAVGISSEGGEKCLDGYLFAGASKAVLETLCRYLAVLLKTEGVRVNALRPGFLDTESARATFGDAAVEAAKARAQDLFLDPNAVARACVGLCSGLMDSVTGQVIVVDEGTSIVSRFEGLTGSALPEPFGKGGQE